LSAPDEWLELSEDPDGPIDVARLGAFVEVRLRVGGERLRPGAKARTRTLKALLQETRIAAADRARLPLVFSGGELIAVADRWVDARIAATAKSKRRARLIWHRPPHG
jgi:tRNA(Ile)-lysidine synthase